jgi:hypothetical protein
MLMPSEPPLDDRARDQDLDRLRDSVAHVIDVARSRVRRALDAGVHPEDALIEGLSMLEHWELGMKFDRAATVEAYAADVERVLAPVTDRVGADRLWAWLREPNRRLRGRTPLVCLVAHKAHDVAGAAEDISPAAPAPTETRPPAVGNKPPVPRLTIAEFEQLVDSGLLGEQPELHDGRLRCGSDPRTGAGYDVVFTPAQARAAAALGIRVHSAVDAVLSDPDAVAEVLARLAQRLGPAAPPSASGEQP